MLLADCDREQCNAVELYRQWQDRVELCAVVHSADRVLELLHAGLRPDVLVLDMTLPGCGLIGLLRRLPTVDAGYRPRVLLTGVPIPPEVRQLFLTLGAQYIILKPYSLDDLFEAAYIAATTRAGCDPDTLHIDLNRLLREMHVGVHGCGARYLEKVVGMLLRDRESHTMGELYAQVAQAEHLSVAAVVSGIGRMAARAWQVGSPAYAALCAESGRPQGTRLTSAEFAHGLAECLRRGSHR